MPAKMLRMIAVAAVCFCDGAFAAAAGQPRHAPASVQGSAGYLDPICSRQPGVRNKTPFGPLTAPRVPV